MTGDTASGRADQTRQGLLDAGASLVEEHGLAGLSVNMVVARAGVAKGTFYVHFSDRSAFVDAMHERFHDSVQEAMAKALGGMPPGAERIYRRSEVYLDVSLANRGVKALGLETRSDPSARASMAVRRERLTAAGVADLKAMGWRDAAAAAELSAAMTREISVLEFDAGKPLPASRRALKRFLGL